MLKIEKIAIATVAVLGASLFTPTASQAGFGFDDIGVSAGGVTVCLTTSCTVKHTSKDKDDKSSKRRSTSRDRDAGPKHVDHRTGPKHVDHRSKTVDHRSTGTTTYVSDHPEDFELHEKDGIRYYTRKRAKPQTDDNDDRHGSDHHGSDHHGSDHHGSDHHNSNHHKSDPHTANADHCKQLQALGYRILCN